MFFAFAIFGMVPVGAVALVPLANPKINPHDLFVAACVVTAIALFFLGAYKAKFNDKRCARYLIHSQPRDRIETAARPRGPNVGRTVSSREAHSRCTQVPSLGDRGIAPRRRVRYRRLRRRARRQRLRHRRALRRSVIDATWTSGRLRPATWRRGVGAGTPHSAPHSFPITTIIINR